MNEFKLPTSNYKAFVSFVTLTKTMDKRKAVFAYRKWMKVWRKEKTKIRRQLKEAGLRGNGFTLTIEAKRCH